PPDQIAGIVGLCVDDLDGGLPIQDASIGISFTMIPVRTLEAMQRARFNRSAYDRQAATRYAQFLFSSETSSPNNQIHARMFAEPLGVAEDPATGSACACLGNYLLQHHHGVADHLDIRVEQGYEVGRPSLVQVRAERNATEVDVFVGGHVVPTFRGEL